MSYRASSPSDVAENVVVDYRPMNVSRVVIMLVMVTLGAMLVYFGVTTSRTVRLDCERTAMHRCVVAREYGPITLRDSVPLSHIEGVRLQPHRFKDNTKYSVVLHGRFGSIELTRDTTKHADAERAQRAIDAFLSGSAPSATIRAEDGSLRGGVILTLLGLSLAGSILLFLTSARLEFDFRRRVIYYTLKRFPLPSVERTLRSDAVVCASVVEGGGPAGALAYGVVLAIDGEPDFQLVGHGTSDEEQHDEVAARINSLLRKMRGDDREAARV